MLEPARSYGSARPSTFICRYEINVVRKPYPTDPTRGKHDLDLQHPAQPATLDLHVRTVGEHSYSSLQTFLMVKVSPTGL